jgi:hypothetical protein
MLSKRGFLNGLGVGIIIGAVLLHIINYTESFNNKPLLTETNSIEKNWDESKFKALADAHSFKVYGKSDKLYTEAELTIETAKRINEVKQVVPIPAVVSATTNPSPTITSTPLPTISYTIKEGMFSSEVAENLEQLGIIKDSSAFLQTLKQKQLDTKLQRATFSFTANEKIDDVITLITTPLK